MLRNFLLAVLLYSAFDTLLGCATPPEKKNLPTLVATTQPCATELRPPWMGIIHETIVTGLFATNPESVEKSQANWDLKFDWFSFPEKPSRLNFGPKWIAQRLGPDSVGSIYSYRSSLPSDEQIALAKTVPELQQILGPSQGFTDAWGSDARIHFTVMWNYFTLTHPDWMETVSIFCMVSGRRGEPAHVDSMRVVRGVARPEH